MRRWSWAPIPARILSDHRFLRASDRDRLVLLSLYPGSNEHGLFVADEVWLRSQLGLVTGADPVESVQRLAAVGLVRLYEVDGDTYGELDRFNEDDKSGTTSKRPESLLPHHPDRIRTASGPHPDTIRTPSALPDHTGPDHTQPDRNPTRAPARPPEGLSAQQEDPARKRQEIPIVCEQATGPDGYPDAMSALRAEAWATRCNQERKRRHGGRGYMITEMAEMRDGLASFAREFGGAAFVRAVNAMLAEPEWPGQPAPSERLRQLCRDGVAA